MKNKKIVTILLVVLFLSVGFFLVLKKDKKIELDNVIIKESNNKSIKFAMYKEVNGSYEEYDSETFPTINDGYILNEEMSKCIDESGNEIPNILSYDITNQKVKVDTDKTSYCYLYFKSTIYTFDYTGSEQTFTVPYTGTYKLETWGAQGGSFNETYQGGYGAYSTGNIVLNKNDVLYINAGGKGIGSSASRSSYQGGYNGGGRGVDDPNRIGANGIAGSSGGGATHIATKSGLLSTLEGEREKVLIISGAGGGSSNYYNGGNGGGIKGNDGNGNPPNQPQNGFGGTQTSPGNNSVASNATIGGFGYGAIANTWGTGGGSGYYGGGVGGGNFNSAGGGSGYIGNSLLTNKHMTCYNCTTSNVESTKTVTNTCVSDTPTTDCSKKGNGYAKITFIG